MSTIQHIDNQFVATVVAAALQRSASKWPSKLKTIASRVGISDRTVQNIYDGSNAPSAATLIRLMREFEPVHNAVLDLAGRPSHPKKDYSESERIQLAMSILSGGTHDSNHY